MDEVPIPGSRVRATTKHGPLTVDEIAEMVPGLARLMDELSRRYWVIYYAAKAGNWGLAAYMHREIGKLLETMAVARPTYREDLEAFARDHLGAMGRAIEAKDWEVFDETYRKSVEASDVYHEKYRKAFIRFRIPDRPPDWFDLASR